MALTAGPLPLYFQIAEDVRGQIARESLKPGDALPPEERLCLQYGVSRITVRRAVDDLITQGLIVRRRGVGTFVAESHEVTRSVSLVGSLYEALAYPKNIAIEVLGTSERKPPTRVAEALDQSGEIHVTEYEVLSRVGKIPFGATRFYFPLDIGRRLSETDLLAGTPVARSIERLLQEPIARASQVVEPELADAHLAGQLEIARHTAVLHVWRTYYTAAGRPVEVVSVRYRPDQYSLRVELLPNSPTGPR